MSWKDDDNQFVFDFDPMTEDDTADGASRTWTGLLIGAALGIVTLILIVALIFTTVGYFLMPKATAKPQITNGRPQPAPPSAADLRNANYRPSDWTGSDALQAMTPTPIGADVVYDADAEYRLLTNIYYRVSPSVVNIEIVSTSQTITDFVDSSGSGFVFDAKGHIVTNAHVVRDAQEILVTFSDGDVANASLVGIDDYSDLAVIQVDASHTTLVPAELGDSNDLDVGQRVIAIGNPFGLAGSMTMGIVSALDRSLPSARLLDPNYDQYSNPSIIQVDAAVNPGNSGGPLLDSFGRVIGVNTAIRTDNGGFQGIAFAVPVNTLKRVIPQLIAGGAVEYSWLGISSPVTDGGYSVAALADEMGFKTRTGILVSEVFPDSPAAHAGLQSGTDTKTVRGVAIPVNADIIVAVNGKTVRSIDDLLAYLVENTSPRDVVTLTIVRGDQTLDLDVTLGTRPDN